ncbi:MAG: barstar family protein [Firmicutes bacterium]|jgi:ribonuclease inhibitor|nr:barstar family protein [Alphaproteobacteria bacterium]MCT4634258.1 barstar family protein [Bacillota bacterium]
MQVVIDGSKFNDKEQFHSYIKELMDLPDYYGGNLDALWDCLTGWVDLPMHVKWINFTTSKISLGDYADSVLETFKDAEEELGADFRVDIED